MNSFVCFNLLHVSLIKYVPSWISLRTKNINRQNTILVHLVNHLMQSVRREADTFLCYKFRDVDHLWNKTSRTPFGILCTWWRFFQKSVVSFIWRRNCLYVFSVTIATTNLKKKHTYPSSYCNSMCVKEEICCFRQSKNYHLETIRYGQPDQSLKAYKYKMSYTMGATCAV